MGSVVLATYWTMFRWRRHVRITLESGGLTYHGAMRKRVIDPTGCRLVTVWAENPDPKAREGESRYMLLVDRDGRAQLTLSATRWDAAELEALSSRLHLTPDATEHHMTLAYMGKTFPGVPWAVANPKAAGWTMFGVFVAAILAAAAI
jgi:hypothetical protein